jgi:cysteine synthase B
MPNQYDNDANFLSHYESTGPEIWKQTGGTLTHFLTGCGTGGTITGTATFLKEKNKNVHAIAIQAQKNHLLQGLRNFEESAIPELFKRRLDVVDEWMTATNKDSFEAVRQLVEKETMLVGPSSGSVMTSMLRVAHNLDHGIIVGIFADDGRKFKSLYTREKVLTEQEYDRALNSAKHMSKVAYS